MHGRIHGSANGPTEKRLMSRSWIMFGHSHLLGDIFDLITDSGGRLSKIVLNIPEGPTPPRRLPLSERLARLPYRVESIDLSGFTPSLDESYVIGFSGRKMAPLLDKLKDMFGIACSRMIHSKAILQHGVQIAESSLVDAGAIVGPWAKIGRHVFLNRGSSVGHDCEIGDFSFLAPSATLCGYVRLGEDVMIGAGAIVLPDVTIGESAAVTAGAVVTKDVPAGATVAGARAWKRSP